MMSKSKFYMSPSTDEAASLKGDGADVVCEGLVSFPTPIKKYTSEEHTTSVAAGRLPEEVYVNMLPWWRAALRRKCVEVVEWESKVIGEWQVRSFFLSPPPFFFFLFLSRLPCRGEREKLTLSFCRHACGRPGWTRIFCIRRCSERTRSSSCSCPRFSSLDMTSWEGGKRAGFLFIVTLG
jgi:hypothetical protein